MGKLRIDYKLTIGLCVVAANVLVGLKTEFEPQAWVKFIEGFGKVTSGGPARFGWWFENRLLYHRRGP